MNQIQRKDQTVVHMHPFEFAMKAAGSGNTHALSLNLSDLTFTLPFLSDLTTMTLKAAL